MGMLFFRCDRCGEYFTGDSYRVTSEADGDVLLTGATLAQWLDEKEKQFIAQKLEDCGGSIALTARSCDIGLRSLYRKMQKYGLDKKRFKHNSAPRKAIATKNHRPVAEAEQLDPDPPRTL